LSGHWMAKHDIVCQRRRVAPRPGGRGPSAQQARGLGADLTKIPV